MKNVFGRAWPIAAVLAGCAALLGCAGSPPPALGALVPMTPEMTDAVGIGPYVPRPQRRQLGEPFQYHISHGIRLELPPAEEGDFRILGGQAVREIERHRAEVSIGPSLVGVVPQLFRDVNPRFGGTGEVVAIGPGVEQGDAGFRLVIYVSFETYTVGFGANREVREPMLRFVTRWNPSATARFYLYLHDAETRMVFYAGAYYTAVLANGQPIPLTLGDRPFLNIRSRTDVTENRDERRVRGRRI